MNKYLKLFVNHSAYSQSESNLDKPNVTVCQQEGDIHYNPYVAPTLITFTIDDEINNVQHTLQAEKGMTWGEWVNSNYNTLGLTTFTSNNNNCYITYPNEDYWIFYGSDRNYADAQCSEQIIENYTYSANTQF